MNSRSRIQTLLLIAMTLLLSGCGGLSVERMIPPTRVESSPRFDGALRVLPVTGAKLEQWGGPALVSNETYREALVAALRKSNLFARVETEKAGDYELQAQFVAHGQGPGMDYRSAMVVQYRILAAGSQTELWSQGFNSRNEVSVSQAFSGAARTIEAQEGSVRDNLAQLIEALSKAELKR